jgi:hypothetical protein
MLTTLVLIFIVIFTYDNENRSKELYSNALEPCSNCSIKVKDKKQGEDPGI